MERSGNFYKAIQLGYILISILIGCMAYNSLYEWQEIEALELGNKKIDELRKEINNINIQMIKFSLLGETILEWNDKDIEHYHARRMAMDSMLCRFKATYPAERIDSVRSLLEDKERQMFQIVRLMDEQQSINKKIVIDLGKSSSFSPVNDFLLPLFKKRGEVKYYEDKYYLSQVFISHPHQDHISDLSDLDKHFYIDLYTTPNDLTKGADAHRKNVNWNLVDDPDGADVKKIKEVYKGRQLPLRVSLPSKMTLGYIYPGDVEDNETLTNESYTNNISLVLYIHAGYKILFAADVQKEGMKQLLEDDKELKKKIGQGVDFLVCPHHGLRSSFSTELFDAMKDGKTKKLNIVSEKSATDDKRNVDSRYSSTDYCEGDNNLSTEDNIVCQRKTSQGHIFIDDDGTVTVESDIKKIIDKF